MNQKSNCRLAFVHHIIEVRVIVPCNDCEVVLCAFFINDGGLKKSVFVLIGKISKPMTK